MPRKLRGSGRRRMMLFAMIVVSAGVLVLGGITASGASVLHGHHHHKHKHPKIVCTLKRVSDRHHHVQFVWDCHVVTTTTTVQPTTTTATAPNDNAPSTTTTTMPPIPPCPGVWIGGECTFPQ